MEATVVCLDNSEWTRNGDYAPTRFEAQADAVNLLAGAKTQHHPENTVGVMSMAGAAPRVLVTPTPELGKVLHAVRGVRVGGAVDLTASVQIAQLVLKHRENKNQRQRVVVFVASPIREDAAALTRVGRKLKKNGVAVDVVSFGSETENAAKLEAFHEAVNSGGNSNLVTVPPGTILSDQLFSTSVFMEEGATATGGGAGASGTGQGASLVVDGFDYGALGVNPEVDPELALALRVSMEEERQRQAAAAAAAGDAGGDGAPAEGSSEPGVAPADGSGAIDAATAATPAAPRVVAPPVDEEDEDALLQEALALSMDIDEPVATGAPAAAAAPAVAAGPSDPAATPAPAGMPVATPAAPSKAGSAPADASTPVPPTGASAAEPQSHALSADELDFEDDPELALAIQMSMAQEQPGDGDKSDE